MKKAIVLIWGTLLWVSVTQAQPYFSVGGRFQVDQIRGCAPLTVTLTNLLAGNCDAANPCSMDYLGNNQQTLNLFTFQYNTPGIYQLKVLYQGQGADVITITVVPNVEPDFEIYSCANSDVKIKVLEKSYQQMIIDFTNDGIPEATIPSGNNATATHDYATPGNKTISVRGYNLNSADNCASKVKTFDALATLPAPTINTLTIADKSTIKLDFSIQPNIQYRLEIAVGNAGPFQLAQTLYDVNTFTLSSLSPEINYYCFRLGALDACNGASNYSNIICSSKVNLSIEDGLNKLSWITANTGIQSTEVERDNATFTIIPGAPTSFNDIDIECKTQYCYRVINRYGGGARSISLQYCGTSFKVTNPPAVINTSAVVTNTGLKLEWQQEPGSTPSLYNILISADGQNFGPLAFASATNYTDKNYLTESSFTYQVEYTDECDNKSAKGLTIDPIRLTGAINNNVISISWNEYQGWNNGVSNYFIDKFNLQGNLIKSIDVGLDTSFTDDEADPDNQFVAYRIRATPNQSGIPVSISNKIDFIKDSKIFFPTAFSPNGDALNDRFFVSGQFIVEMELTIFNRWGELIFITNDKNDTWDGTFNNKPAAEDAYVWSIQVTDLAGRTYKESGTVALLRKKN
ncbi:MAG TPA: gliding motility-associated C-terminal domain-containing protein [Cyclobacteriaceae bacterium]